MEKIIESSVNIPSKANLRVMWEDEPQNYSKERVKRITSYFSQKYGIENVQVVFKPKKNKSNDDSLDVGDVDNVMDINYQRTLFKQWLDNNSINIDWERLIKLDDKVNDKLKEIKDIEYRYKNWNIKSIEWDNFLSYGDGNILNYEELSGITVINSDPQNFGGKCLRHNTEIEVEFDEKFIIDKLGYLPDELI
jgi:hypothetical protein